MTLPESISTEKSLLGSILFNADLIPTAIEKVPADSIYDSCNKKIYQTIIDLYDNGIIPDNVIVYDKIKGDINLENRLYDLGDCETSLHIEHYCRIIVEKWLRRKIIEKSNILTNNSSNNDYPIGTLVNQFENLMVEIGESCDLNNIERKHRGGLIKLNDFKEQVIRFYENGFQNIGISTGWKTLDAHYRPAKGTLNIITGIPGHGKSEFVDAVMINTSIKKGWKWAIFSPENFPYELHIQKLVEKFHEKPFFKEGKISTEELERAIIWINEHIIFINPSDNNITLDALLKLVLEAIEKNKIDGFVFDPWNEIEINLKDGENETSYIGRSLSKARRFARRHNVLAYIVAHPAKMYKNRDTNEYNVPTMYDISGSAHWYNKADNGLCIHRDFQNSCVDIHIQKIKFKIHGSVGVVTMKYNKINGCFTETEGF